MMCEYTSFNDILYSPFSFTLSTSFVFLQGEQGYTGPQGENGPMGTPGDPGEAGTIGDQGDQVWKSAHIFYNHFVSIMVFWHLLTDYSRLREVKLKLILCAS